MNKGIAIFIVVMLFLNACMSSESTPAPTHTANPTDPPEPTFTPAPTLVPYFDKPGQYLEVIQIEGETRWFSVYIPENYLHGTLTPLVINFHGAGSSLQEQTLISGMNEKAETEGFISVYPQASSNNSRAWFLADGPAGSIDVEFTQAIIDSLREKSTIDPQRIYATGFSNGGGLVHSLGCLMSDTFAAIAPVAGAYVYWAPCEINSPVSVIAIHGDADPAVAYSGGGYSTPDWAETWAKRNGCDAGSTTSQPYDDIFIQAWETCPDGVAVMLFTIAGGGHIWPGSEIYPDRSDITKNLNATNIIWAFFKAHPKP
jgi:polyhydroxybutyrate depolymerase